MDLAAFFTMYKDALITVSWVLAAAGWVVNNNQSNQREKRKETKAEIDGICKAAADVLGLCRKYYEGGPQHAEDDSRAAEIAFQVKRVLIRTERLSSRISEFSAARPACEDFFEAVTREPFQSKARLVHGPQSPVLKEVESGVHVLIDTLEDCYTTAFRGLAQRLNPVKMVVRLCGFKTFTP